MKHVNLYVYNSIRGVRASNGAIGYLLEYETENGPYTKDEKHTVYQMTRQAAELTAINEALTKVREPCEIRIFTLTKPILNAWKNGWIDTWMESDGKKASGEEIANLEQWRTLYRFICKHEITITDEHHSYESWLKNEVETLTNRIFTL